VFIDYAGTTFPVLERLTSEATAQTFVAVLGASNFIYREHLDAMFPRRLTAKFASYGSNG
jgi:hypothetical protein